MNNNIILDMNFNFDKNGFDVLYNQQLTSTGSLMVLLDFYKMIKTNWKDYKFKNIEDYVTVLSKSKNDIYNLVHQEYENQNVKNIHIRVVENSNNDLKEGRYEAEDGFGPSEVFMMSLFFIEYLEQEYGDMGLQTLIEILKKMETE